MAEIMIQKCIKNGWPVDEEPCMIDESLLVKTEGGINDENECSNWTEWRLDGLIVKRGAHVRLKQNVAAEAVAAMFN